MHSRGENQRDFVPGAGHRQRGSGAKRALRWADRVQQRHKALAVPVAVLRKYSEDKSSNLATMIAFTGFFSVFPLLLVFVTLLDFLVPASTKAAVMSKVASMFPLVNTGTVHSLSGQWWPLILGLATALWSGLAVVRVTQFAFDSAWEIPYLHRPKIFRQVLRSLSILATVGVGLVVSMIITGYVSGTATGIGLGVASRVGGYVLAVLLDVGLFVAIFRILTERSVTAAEVLPGAVLSGLAFWVLQSASSLIISHYLHKSQSTYGHFATVITILWWFYLQSLITMVGAQLNVVLRERLYPRSLTGEPATEADRRAMTAYAQERTYHPQERVHTDFRRGG